MTVSVLLLLVLAAAAVVAVGFRSAGASPGASPSASPSAAVRCGLPATGSSSTDFTVSSGPASEPLRALVHVPARLRGRPAPLVLAFHGSGGSGPFMRGYSSLARLADRKGFVVAFPTAPSEQRTWQLAATAMPDRDDVGAVRGLLDQIEQRGCVDRSRVFAVGVSNGGGFTARLGCELADRISGIVVVAGGFSQLAACQPTRPVSVLEIHGSADHVVPYRGKPDSDFRGAVRPWLAQWAKRDGCRTQPRRLRSSAGVQRMRWADCKDGTRVQHIVVDGGQHAWPGATPRDPGPSPIDAGSEAWAFLSQLKPRH